MRRLRLPPALALGLTGLLAAQILLTPPDIAPAPGPGAAPPPPAVAADPPVTPDLAARPLFTRLRRPPASSTDNAPDVAGLAVVGIVTGRGADIALVKPPDGPPGSKARTLRVGQNLGDWTLTGIEQNALIFRRGDSIHRLTFKRPPPAQRP
ncbi:hypothetical protein [Oleisolibacter albus]|uniref:hypothetical protein n=1 Tax=Oleisolibacter albus TaxID=2171757 RepID=UPI000DF38963|nr:hypothetical protein [Oleisolibacter albus]